MTAVEDLVDGDYVEGSLRLLLCGCGSVDVPYHVDRSVDRVGSPVFLRWVICVHEAEAYERDAGPLTDRQRSRLYDPVFVEARAVRVGARQPALFDS